MEFNCLNVARCLLNGKIKRGQSLVADFNSTYNLNFNQQYTRNERAHLSIVATR